MRRIALIVIPLLFASAIQAAPRAELWPRWQAHDPQQAEDIDHSAWTELLSRHVATATHPFRFRYGAVSPGERQALAAYLTRLQAVRISDYARPAQLAYWINLYNALTIQVVLDHYPVASITRINISPGLFSRGPWGKSLATVEGEALSLNDIEHRILRPVFADPRVHYAVNCASLGCPNLQPQAYTASNLDGLLELGARQFVNHSRGVRFDGEDLTVSSIYRWFRADFGANDQALIKHLQRYASPALQARLAGRRDVDDDEYDWRLNDAVQRP